MLYTDSLLNPSRRLSHEVRVGDLIIGGRNPIVVQSMTTAATTDTLATVQQIQDLIEVGCQLVRVTTPTHADVENLVEIRKEMQRRGLRVPLVADVHFLPKIALRACDLVEKVRINPGNFADRKRFEVLEYTDAEYQQELDRIRDAFLPIVRRAKENGVALRIGTNHGSLSDRILNRYGDTPLGMVESALEFVEIAEDEGFHNIVLSMKASNTQVMIQAYRLLVQEMDRRSMNYPLHLGVTEAGDGDDGRIKSAVGIGSLLMDGLGDTVRVSLTEDSVREIPVARNLIDILQRPFRDQMQGHPVTLEPVWSVMQYQRRNSDRVPDEKCPVGEKQLVRVRTRLLPGDVKNFAYLPQRLEPEPELVVVDANEPLFAPEDLKKIQSRHPLILRLPLRPAMSWSKEVRVFDQISMHPNSAFQEPAYFEKFLEVLDGKPLWFIVRSDSELEEAVSWIMQIGERVPVGLEFWSRDIVPLGRKAVAFLHEKKIKPAIHLHLAPYPNESEDSFLLRSSAQLGSLLCDGIGDSIEITYGDDLQWNQKLAFNILQATRLRMEKTEYIACPSCGRTLFDLQETTARIRAQTGHLKGVKIAIMGCIVNGPGEMADADFGYVGSGPGYINLYVGKECVERKIPQEEADSRLIQLIKAHNRWAEPS